MAKIIHDGNGNIIAIRRNDAEEAKFGLPAGTIIEFDEEANAAVLAAIDTDWNSHAIQAGKLRRNGVDVTIAANSANTTKRKQIRQLLTALDAGTASSANQQKAIAFLIRQFIKD